MSQKGFVEIAIVIGVLVLVAIGGAYYLGIQKNKSENATTQMADVPASPSAIVQPTNSPPPSPDPTENWNILNNKNGFSIKYPTTLKIVSDELDENISLSSNLVIASKPGYSDDTGPALRIRIVKTEGSKYKNRSLSQISTDNYEANQNNKNIFREVIIPLKSTTLDNQLAYTYTLLSSGYSGLDAGMPLNASITNIEKLGIIEAENNGNYFLILYSAEDSQIKTILSTFKFTP